MSNCHVVAGRSPIALAASRLALRAPALRAATALTRPNQSAPRLPCGRHTVPTTEMVGPNNVVANHRVERSDHLAHDRNDHNLRQLACGLEPIVEHLEHRIPITRAHRRHVEHVTNWRTTAPDTTPLGREIEHATFARFGSIAACPVRATMCGLASSGQRRYSDKHLLRWLRLPDGGRTPK